MLIHRFVVMNFVIVGGVLRIVQNPHDIIGIFVQNVGRIIGEILIDNPSFRECIHVLVNFGLVRCE